MNPKRHIYTDHKIHITNRRLTTVLFALLAGLLLWPTPALAQQVTDIAPPMTAAAGDHSSLSTSFPALINGDFDLPGGSGWVQETTSPSSGHDLIVSEDAVTGVDAHTPPNLVWLGGTAGVTDNLYQQVSLPVEYPTVQLSYRYWIESEERDCESDLFRLRVFTVDTGEYHTVDRTFLCTDTQTSGWQQMAIPLGAFAGREIRIHFVADLDSEGDISNLFLDNVYFCDNSNQHSCGESTDMYRSYLPMTSYHIPFPQLVNGNFDLDSGGGWQEHTTSENPSEHDLIVSQSHGSLDEITAHSAPNLAWLGGTDDVADDLSQEIFLPAEYPAVQISYWYWIKSNEEICGDDRFRLRIYSADTGQYDSLNTTNLCTATQTSGWQHIVIPMRDYVGQAIRVHFGAAIDSDEAASSIFVDSVKLCDHSSLHACD